MLHSPKTKGYLQRSGHALKIVVRPEWADAAWDIVRDLSAAAHFFHYYLQPLTIDGAAVNLPQVLAMVQDERNRGAKWALSTQAHRLWKIH